MKSISEDSENDSAKNLEESKSPGRKSSLSGVTNDYDYSFELEQDRAFRAKFCIQSKVKNSNFQAKKKILPNQVSLE